MPGFSLPIVVLVALVAPAKAAQVQSAGTPAASARNLQKGAAQAVEGWKVMLGMKSGTHLIDPVSGERGDWPAPGSKGEPSPNGTKTAYVETATGGRFVLIVADMDASASWNPTALNPRAATPEAEEMGALRWLPDEKAIAFLARMPKDETAQTYMVNLETLGSSEGPAPCTRLSDGQGRCSRPLVSKEGAVAFVQERERRGKEFASDLVVFKEGHAATLVSRKPIFSTCWRPDGRALMYSVPGTLIEVSLKGDYTREIVLEEVNEGLFVDVAYDLDWHPNGKVVAALLRFPGGRMEGTKLFSDDKLFFFPQEGEGEPWWTTVPEHGTTVKWAKGENIR